MLQVLQNKRFYVRFWEQNFCFFKLINVKTTLEAKGVFQYWFFLVNKEWIRYQRELIKYFMLIIYVIKSLSAWKRKLRLYRKWNTNTPTAYEKKWSNEIKLTKYIIALSFCFYLHLCITEAPFWGFKWEFEWWIFLKKLWNKYNPEWNILRKINFLLICQSWLSSQRESFIKLLLYCTVEWKNDGIWKMTFSFFFTPFLLFCITFCSRCFLISLRECLGYPGRGWLPQVTPERACEHRKGGKTPFNWAKQKPNHFG